MNEQMVMGIVTESLYTALIVGGPILILTLVVGLLVSIFQAATQIQEQTLTFVPKLITIAAILIVSGNWMLNKIMIFTQQIMNMIANIKG
nr:flagellar biosynthesis protein FliQ [uncultured Romboutsia sp.]